MAGLVRLFCEVVGVSYYLIAGLTNGYDKPKPIQDWCRLIRHQYAQ